MPFALSFLSEGFLGKHLFSLYERYSSTDLIFVIIGIVLVIVAAYVLGSINFAIIISGRHYKEDIRTHGSKNAGMTNMMRTYGKKAAALTLLGDALKAIAAGFIGYIVIGPLGAHVAGLFCILGHVFPVFYGFKGGKGVVTAFATVLMCDPPVFLVLITIFVIIVLFTKYISLGSVMCMLLYPILLDTFTRFATGGATTSPYIPIAILVAIIIVAKHWTNIKRLLNGTESKFSFKKSVKAPAADEIKSEENK